MSRQKCDKHNIIYDNWEVCSDCVLETELPKYEKDIVYGDVDILDHELDFSKADVAVSTMIKVPLERKAKAVAIERGISKKELLKELLEKAIEEL